MENNEEIGLFSLRLFLLPEEQTTLHIFEPRYLQLTSECLFNKTVFGIPFQGKTALSEFGSIVSVEQVLKKYENGEVDILVECKSNFKLSHYQGKSENKLYPVGMVKKLTLVEGAPSKELLDAITIYFNLLHDKELTEEIINSFSMKNIVKMLKLSDDEKLRFVTITDLDKQNDFLLKKTRYITVLIEQEKNIEQNFHLN